MQVIQSTGLLDTTLQMIQRLEPLDINGAGDTEDWNFWISTVGDTDNWNYCMDINSAR